MAVRRTTRTVRKGPVTVRITTTVKTTTVPGRIIRRPQ